MARLTLERNVKFKALVQRLALPRPYIRGLLETMWDVANESGNPILGTEQDVEYAAEWPGELGVLFKELKDGRWIDQLDDQRWCIHDYWDHAPVYVRDRKRKEDSRKNNDLGHESPGHSGKRPSISVPLTLALTPTHTPYSPPAGGVVAEKRESPQGDSGEQPAAEKRPSLTTDAPPGFLAFWQEWPAHFRKRGRTKCMRIWVRNKLESIAPQILTALRRFKSSPEWKKQNGQFIPGPEPWLNNESWEVPEGTLSPQSDVSPADDNGFVRAEPDPRFLDEIFGEVPKERTP